MIDIETILEEAKKNEVNSVLKFVGWGALTALATFKTWAWSVDFGKEWGKQQVLRSLLDENVGEKASKSETENE